RDGAPPKAGQALHEGADTVLRGGTGKPRACRMDKDIEAGLAHVDADEGEIMYHGLAPRLVVRAKSPSNRSGSKGAGRALLDRGLQSQPEGTATCLHRPGCASRPMQASKPHLIHTSPRMTEGRTGCPLAEQCGMRHRCP